MHSVWVLVVLPLLCSGTVFFSVPNKYEKLIHKGSFDFRAAQDTAPFPRTLTAQNLVTWLNTYLRAGYGVDDDSGLRVVPTSVILAGHVLGQGSQGAVYASRRVDFDEDFGMEVFEPCVVKYGEGGLHEGSMTHMAVAAVAEHCPSIPSPLVETPIDNVLGFKVHPHAILHFPHTLKDGTQVPGRISYSPGSILVLNQYAADMEHAVNDYGIFEKPLRDRLDSALVLVERALAILVCLHKGGVVHRDIKLENMLHSPSHRRDPIRGMGQFVIADFGAACSGCMPVRGEGVFGDPCDHCPKILMGTPLGLPPEYFLEMMRDRTKSTRNNDISKGTRTDCYGLGTILLQLLRPRHAFRGSWLPDIPKFHVTKAIMDPELAWHMQAVWSQEVQKRSGDVLQTLTDLDPQTDLYGIRIVRTLLTDLMQYGNCRNAQRHLREYQSNLSDSLNF